MTDNWPHEEMSAFAEGALFAATEYARLALERLHTTIMAREELGSSRHNEAFSACTELLARLNAETILLFRNHYPNTEFDTIWTAVFADIQIRTQKALRHELQIRLGLDDDKAATADERRAG